MDQVILVNEKDEVIGQMEKLEAHQKGLLHRAFSVFVFNEKNELLIQKRAETKYHSGGLWTNTCCSHPKPNESTLEGAQRRLKEEMGMEVSLKNAFHFIYKVDFDNGLTEYELDHVLIGYSNEDPILNPEEASQFKWVGFNEILNSLKYHPNSFTFWFKHIFDQHLNLLTNELSHESL